VGRIQATIGCGYVGRPSYAGLWRPPWASCCSSHCRATRAWTFFRNATVAQEQQAIQSGQKLTELRQAISAATTHQELQTQVQKLFGPNAGLSPAELRTPMPELRIMLLARAEQASNQLMQQIEAQAAMRADRLVKETIRMSISALAYATGFAFLAGVLPGHQAADARSRRPDEVYFEKLAD
jgi:hypothetical protein